MKWRIYHSMVMTTLALTPQMHARIIKKKVSIPHGEYRKATEPIAHHPPITIWIHGTKFIRRPVFKTFFKETPGLKLAKDLASDYYLHKIAVTLNKTAPKVFPMETFYLFGWSGKLRTQVRIDAAKVLYEEIHRIVAEYKKTYHCYPEIRIIGHSHGGNVALYMGEIKNNNYEPLHIKELILLACPVQHHTKKYIEDEIFERTYALYSSLDMIQVLAPQVVYNVYKTKRGHLRTEMKWNFLSGRCFDYHCKLKQVKIKVNGRALFHTEFSRPHFVRLLPHVLHVINTWNVGYTHSPEDPKLLCVYTRKEQKFNEKKARVRA